MAGILVADVIAYGRGTCDFAQVGVLANCGNARSSQGLAFAWLEQGYGAHNTSYIISHSHIGQVDVAGVGDIIGPDNSTIHRYVWTGCIVGIISVGALDQAYARRLADVMAGVLIADVTTYWRRARGIAQVGILAGGGNAVSRQGRALAGTEKGYGAHQSRDIICNSDIGQVHISSIDYQISPDNCGVLRDGRPSGAVGIIAIGALDQA